MPPLGPRSRSARRHSAGRRRSRRSVALRVSVRSSSSVTPPCPFGSRGLPAATAPTQGVNLTDVAVRSPRRSLSSPAVLAPAPLVRVLPRDGARLAIEKLTPRGEGLRDAALDDAIE